jgi:hypothetical protein
MGWTLEKQARHMEREEQQRLQREAQLDLTEITIKDIAKHAAACLLDRIHRDDRFSPKNRDEILGGIAAIDCPLQRIGLIYERMSWTVAGRPDADVRWTEAQIPAVMKTNIYPPRLFDKLRQVSDQNVRQEIVTALVELAPQLGRL